MSVCVCVCVFVSEQEQAQAWQVYMVWLRALLCFALVCVYFGCFVIVILLFRFCVYQVF